MALRSCGGGTGRSFAVSCALALAVTLGVAVLGSAQRANAQNAHAIEAVGSRPELEWAFLNDGAVFGPEVARFDDQGVGLVADEAGVAHLQHPDVVAKVLGGDKAASVNDLIVLVTIGSDTVLDGVRLSLAGGEGPSVELSASDAVEWATAFGANPVTGLQSVLGLDRTLGSVLGAAVRFQNGLVAGGETGSEGESALIETIRIEFLGMKHGVAKIDFLGIDANGKIAYNSADAGGAIYEAPAFAIGGVNENGAPIPAVPEPGALGLLALGLAASWLALRCGRGR